mmetsp:Transcript_29020/g.86654  ORF Transcript_29020/g.86654 Transcript_29020/m.86654 type:complete len:225 (+) Transcript_29020:157-831(+)
MRDPHQPRLRALAPCQVPPAKDDRRVGRELGSLDVVHASGGRRRHREEWRGAASMRVERRSLLGAEGKPRSSSASTLRPSPSAASRCGGSTPSSRTGTSAPRPSSTSRKWTGAPRCGSTACDPTRCSCISTIPCRSSPASRHSSGTASRTSCSRTTTPSARARLLATSGPRRSKSLPAAIGAGRTRPRRRGGSVMPSRSTPNSRPSSRAPWRRPTLEKGGREPS